MNQKRVKLEITIILSFSKEAKIYNSETHTLNLYCGLWDYSPISLDMCPTILQNMIDFEKMEG